MSDDRGLQPERTVMAWQRTVLGLGGVSAMLLHHADGRLGASIPGVVGMLVALGTLVLVEVHHERHRDERENSPMGRGAVRALSTATVLLSLASVAVVLGQVG